MSEMQACMDSLAEQNAILKVEVSCLREMPLQFNCCMPGCTKNLRSKGPLQYIIRFQDAKLKLTSFYQIIFFKPIQSLQTYLSVLVASLNHQPVCIRLYDFTGYVFKHN